MKQLIVDLENPNGVLVDMTPEEITDYEARNLADNEKRDALFAKEQADAEAKANNQASGNQKLLDLGLTQAEATALTGYTPPVAE